MKASLKSWVGGALVLATLSLAGTAHAGVVKIPGVNAHAQNPTWSLDGKTLAVEMNTMGQDGISMWFIPVGGDIAKVADIKRAALPGSTGPYGKGQVVMNPSWHPDGLAVFEGSSAGGKFRLYFAMPSAPTAAQMLDTSMAPGNLQFPVVAPNGSVMGYTSDQFGKGDVMTWDRNTGAIKQRTSTSNASEVFPQFNNDGSKMLFTRKVDNAEAVFIVDLATGTETQVVAEKGDQTRPTYADGQIVYFTSERGTGKWDLARIDADGSGKQILVTDVRLPERARPAVSPDGKYVAFVYNHPETWDSVRIMPVAGGVIKEIESDFNTCGEPALTKQDGQYVLAYTALPAGDSDWRFLNIVKVSLP